MNTATLTPPHHRTFYAKIVPTYLPRECEPTFTLERHVAQARRDMGEARWNQLQAEWNAK